MKYITMREYYKTNSKAKFAYTLAFIMCFSAPFVVMLLQVYLIFILELYFNNYISLFFQVIIAFWTIKSIWKAMKIIDFFTQFTVTKSFYGILTKEKVKTVKKIEIHEMSLNGILKKAFDIYGVFVNREIICCISTVFFYLKKLVRSDLRIVTYEVDVTLTENKDKILLPLEIMAKV